MAISGDLRVSATFASYFAQPQRRSLAISKVGFNGFLTGRSGNSDIVPKWPHIKLEGSNMLYHRQQSFRITGENKLSPEPNIQEAESFLLRAINMSFSERLNLAWKVLFPPVPAMRKNSNAKIAKQRLQMILFSDRCEVSDEAKQKIVSKIVCALSDFVIIDSQDKVQLSVSTDSDLGTVYSVTVPVRRVRPEYQYNDEFGSITNIEYKDTGETSGSVDVRFDFFIPDERTR
ncbi:Septum formation topological specificity factor MinE [Macleaya cordata]|uniref:Septum formation topological specificity factor MinE n=1 Tax=Macleaya cordata TaxID=56857 RepID=A0A200QEI5_MACCD|nr:Septum formation topological specificity factor MinE [Macleaya cordata]